MELSKRPMKFYKHYRSIKEFMDAEPNEKTKSKFSNAEWVHPHLHGGHSGNWYGLSGGHKAVMECAKKGWKDGLKKIRQSLKAVQFQGVTSVRRRRVRRDFGDHVDIQSIYSGNIDRAWGTTERSPQRGLGRNVATLMVNIGCLASVSQDQAFWRGALLTTLADALTASGRSVRIVGFHLDENGYKEGKWGDLSCRSFVIKEADQPLMLERLAFVTACVGFMRFYSFRAKCAGHDFTPEYSLGATVHIHPGKVEAKDLPKGLEKQMGDAGTWVIDNIWSQSQAEAFMKKVAIDMNPAAPAGRR